MIYAQIREKHTMKFLYDYTFLIDSDHKIIPWYVIQSKALSEFDRLLQYVPSVSKKIANLDWYIEAIQID